MGKNIHLRAAIAITLTGLAALIASGVCIHQMMMNAAISERDMLAFGFGGFSLSSFGAFSLWWGVDTLVNEYKYSQYKKKVRSNRYFRRDR